MTEKETHTASPPGLVVRKVGWYRDRKTGQRKHWNGQGWTDISEAITPFVYQTTPTVVPRTPAPVVEPPAPPDASRRRPTAMRSMVIVVSAIVTVSVAIVVVATLISGNTVRIQQSAVPSLRAGSGTTAPPNATTPTSVVRSTVITTTSTATSTTAVGALGGPSTTAVAGSVLNVAVIGDSISALAKPDIQRDLHRYNLYVDAVGGTTIAQHLANIQNIASDGLPRDWVIELGTNDAFQKNPNWESDFANEVTALQAQHCVDFVTVNPTFGPVSVGIDTSIANAVATHPNFHSIDWGSTEFRKAGWMLSDHIHPTTSGDVELAKLIRKAVDDC